jgi:hypothetical protein
MRTKTLFSLIVLCGSTAALANLPAQQDTPLANNMTNEGVPAPDDTLSNDTVSPETDVEPSGDPTTSGTETPPNATY